MPLVVALLVATSLARAQDATAEAGWGDADSDAVGFDSAPEASDGSDPDAIGFADPSDEDAIGFGESVAEPAGGETNAPDAEPTQAEEPSQPGPFDLTGFVRTREALWSERFDDNPLAKARQSLDLELRYKQRLDNVLVRFLGAVHAEYDLAYLIDRERFDDETLDTYEWQILGGETFLALSYDALEVTFGRQIVALGQGEILSPLDVVNPRDQREPGLAELDDIRQAVLMSRVGVFIDTHRFEAMVIHENSFDLIPPPLSDFSPLRVLLLDDAEMAGPLGDVTLRYEHVPEDRFETGASQILGRYSYRGHGIDLALYAGTILDRQGVPQLPSPADLELEPTPIRLFHTRYGIIGHAGALPEGDFLLRWELGAEIGRPFAATDESIGVFNLTPIRRTQLVALLGVTYSGITDGTLGFEVQEAVVVDHPERDPNSQLALLAPAEEPTFALRYTHNFLRETLQLIALAMAFGVIEYRGLLARLELSYELATALKVGGGYVTYQPAGDFGPIAGFDQHDRLFLSLRWDFVAF